MKDSWDMKIECNNWKCPGKLEPGGNPTCTLNISFPVLLIKNHSDAMTYSSSHYEKSREKGFKHYTFLY